MAEEAAPIRDRLARIRRRIEHACEEAGREPNGVTLIAVGKTFPAAVVAEAVRAGATDLGENRVQEAASKKEHVPTAVWHLIGPLQRNKAGPALALFDVIHTIDRPELVERLELLLDRDWPGRRLPVLLEVNVGGEDQKAGVIPPAAGDLARAVMACSQLELLGLMTVPPFHEDPGASRPHFAALRILRDDLQQTLGTALPHLSMGMSHDFEVAIAEGATMVRVGTAIFGSRA